MRQMHEAPYFQSDEERKGKKHLSLPKRHAVKKKTK
jgi:hypothetical protein